MMSKDLVLMCGMVILDGRRVELWRLDRRCRDGSGKWMKVRSEIM